MSGTALMAFDDLNVEALAVIANESAEQVESSARKTVEHAERCGRALLAAKEKVPHGQWLGWIGANFNYSRTTASQYMQIANYKHACNLESATSVREALRLISEDPETPKRERKPGVEILPSAPIEVEAKPLPERTQGETATNAVSREETRKAPAHRPPEKFTPVTPSYQDEDEDVGSAPEEPQRDMLDMFEDMKQLIRDAMHEFPSGHRQLIWKQLFEQLNEEDIEQW
jgi:hypothetical protein